MSFALRFGWAAPVCGVLLLGSACDRKADKPLAGASASASAFKPAAPVASGLPGANDRISKAVNPENRPAYAGPTGTVRGLITATGDAAPVATAHLQQIKGDCPEARESYGHVFREGMLRSLADVLVAVTGYEGYVPAKEPKQVIAARGCAFSTRTVALTFGQTLEIVSKDREAYVPNLLGSRMKAQLLALPGGAGSTVYPPEPGHYLLTDDMKLFMMADVFVVKYSTYDVTGLDGKYEIAGIPVGKARISALLPATGAVVEKDIEIKADAPLELPLELPFDAKVAEARRLAALASASAAASAPPAPSSAPPH
jgi:hypothetical protein